MKILHETQDRLVIGDRPVALACILAGMILVTAAIALWLLAEGDWTGLWLSLAPVGFALAFLVFVVRVQATFDRATGLVTIETSSLRRRTRATRPLSDLRHADVQSDQGRLPGPGRKETRMSRPVLDLAGAPVPKPRFGGAARQANGSFCDLTRPGFGRNRPAIPGSPTLPVPRAMPGIATCQRVAPAGVLPHWPWARRRPRPYRAGMT